MRGLKDWLREGLENVAPDSEILGGVSGNFKFNPSSGDDGIGGL